MSPRVKALKAAERALREAVLEAARIYADTTDGGQGASENGAGMMTASKLRIAAKPWRRAELAVFEELRREEGQREP